VGVYGAGNHGFLFNGSTYSALNDPNANAVGTLAFGISGSNIVGYFGDNTGNHGFLYNGSTYTTLDDPNATAGTLAQGIDGSNIVGFYTDNTGVHGFIYTNELATVPEPSSLLLLGIAGIVGIARFRWRRRTSAAG
jgi:hypothetical protein